MKNKTSLPNFLWNFFFKFFFTKQCNFSSRHEQCRLNNIYHTEVNGTFNGWCGNCNAMSDADGDNIWDITIDLANGSYEFKFSADNWVIQENLLFRILVYDD